MAEAVIWDMDGVIADTEPHADLVMAQFLAGKGHKMPVKFLDSVRGRCSKDVCSFVLESFPLSLSLKELTESLNDSYLDYLRALPKLEPVPGVRELITGLSEYGINIALASSSARQRVELVLESLDLKEAFPVRISGEDVENSKPDPQIFLEAAKRMGIRPEKCAVIEDSTFGIIAANSARMISIGFAGLPHNKQDLSTAVLVIKNFTQIHPKFFYDL